MTSSQHASPVSHHFTVFVLLRALPAWLRLDRAQRNAIAEQAMGSAVAPEAEKGVLRLRHFDAEAFTATCSDVAMFETSDLSAFYFAMERLRDTPLFAEPYFELVQIIPAIEDGYRHFEAAA